MRRCAIVGSFGRGCLVACTALVCLSPAGLMAQKTVGTEPGDVRSDNGTMMALCWCPKGTFTMGSPPHEVGRGANEDQVDATLTSGFWMGKCEINQAQYEFVMGKNPSAFRGDSLPVEQVSWNDALAFCDRLTSLEKEAGRLPEGWTYRLPTEAQWEYACRAGTATAYSYGNDANQFDEFAWYDRNAGRKTHDVGRKQANAWGLCDMHGNVFEWCRDGYQAQLPGGVNPEGPRQAANRVFRGGGYGHSSYQGRSAARYFQTPDWGEDFRGFRVALVAATDEPVAIHDEPGTHHHRPLIPTDNEPITLNLAQGPDETLYPTNVAFSHDGSLLAVGAFTEGRGDLKSAIQLWDVNTGQLQERLENLHGVACGRNGMLAAINADGKVRIIDPNSGEDSVIDLGDVFARYVTLSPDGKLLAVTTNHEVQLWDVQTRRRKNVGFVSVVSGSQPVAFSRSGRLLAMGSENTGEVIELQRGDGLRIWNFEAGADPVVLEGHEQPVVSVAVSADDGILASVGYPDVERGMASEIMLWFQGGRRKMMLAGHRSLVAALAFSPDGKLLATAGRSLADQHGVITFWDLAHGPDGVKPLATLNGDRDSVTSVAFRPDGKTLASVGQDQTVRLWQVSFDQPSPDEPPPEQRVVLTVRDEQQRELLLDGAKVVVARAISEDGGRVFRLVPVGAKPEPAGKGEYRLTLEPGKYAALVDRDGYESARHPFEVEDREVRDVILLKRVPPPPPKEREIVITVKDEQQQDALINDAELSIAGVRAQPQSDGRGRYRFLLKPGVYELTVKKDKYELQKGRLEVTDRDIDKTVFLQRVPPPPPREREVVITLRNLERKELAVGDAEISIAGIPAKPKPDGQGRYSISLKPGDYQVTVKTTKGYKSKTTTISVEDEGNPDPIFLTPVSPPTPDAILVLSVVDEAEGDLIEKATISVAEVDVTPQPGTTPGIYQVSGLKQGTSYKVTAKAAGYDARTETVTTLEERTTPYKFELTRAVVPVPTKPFRVTISVVDDQRQPISGLNVVADPGIELEPNAAGDLFACRFEPGTYEVDVEIAGLVFERQLVTVAADGKKLQLQPVQDAAREDQLRDDLMTRVDRDYSGYVDRDDFDSDDAWQEMRAFCDSNKDGVLSKTELREFASRRNDATTERGPEPPAGEEEPPSTNDEEFAVQLHRQLDLDGDQFVTEEDFDSELGWQEFQKLADGNGDQKVDEKELLRVVTESRQSLEAQPLQEEPPEEEPFEGNEDALVADLHGRLDFDFNEKVDQDDFSDLAWKEIKKYDTNGDGRLSLDELRPLVKPNDEPEEEPQDPPERGKLIVRKSGEDAGTSGPRAELR